MAESGEPESSDESDKPECHGDKHSGQSFLEADCLRSLVFAEGNRGSDCVKGRLRRFLCSLLSNVIGALPQALGKLVHSLCELVGPFLQATNTLVKLLDTVREINEAASDAVRALGDGIGAFSEGVGALIGFDDARANAVNCRVKVFCERGAARR